MKRILIISVMLASAAAMAQEKAAKGFFYVYRGDCQMMGRPSVHLDGTRIAKVHKGHWTSVDLPVGTHQLSAEQKDNLVPLNIEAGKSYYFRVGSTGAGLGCTKMRIERVADEQGAAEIAQLKEEGK